MKKILAIILSAMLLYSTAHAIEIDVDANDYVDIEFGGTNAATATGARTNLDIYSTAEVDAAVSITEIGTATYDTLDDWYNISQSAGIISGGAITDGGSGTVNISAITGFVKSTNSGIGVNYSFDLGAITGQALTDESINYIYVDYNAGTPVVSVATSSVADGHTTFNIGKVFREGTSVDIIDAKLTADDLGQRVQKHHMESAALEFVSGAVIAETGTRAISITAGVMYAALSRLTTDAIDTNVADTFEYYYYNGTAWLESDQTQIDNLQYNNIATGLATLANNRYGVHWVYKGTGDNTYVLYGQDSYTLTGAQSAALPATLPPHVYEMGALRGKIIIGKSDTTFTEIEQVSTVNLVSSTPGNHSELGGLLLSASGVTYGHVDDQAQSIAGVKTFSSSPIVPAPTTDLQAATKKYVDDNGGGAPEGTAVLSTGETGGSKYLREDGDGTSSWQDSIAITVVSPIAYSAGEFSMIANAYEAYDTAIVKSDEAETITSAWDFSGATTAAINVVSYSSAQTLSAVNARGSFIVGTAAMVLTLPTAVAGYSGCFLAGQGVTAIIQLTPAAGDYLVVNGVRGTAATAYASAGAAGDKICFVAASADDWYITSEVGTWSE